MKKKIVCLCCALSLSMLAACGASDDAGKPTDAAATNPAVTETKAPAETKAPEETKAQETSFELDPNAAPTDLFHGSAVTDMEGQWMLSKVFADGQTNDAAADAVTLAVTLSLDPSELVDEPAYIHNQVYNLIGDLTFGQESVLNELAADDLKGYRGSTSWSDFSQGEKGQEGQFYSQPGAATMRFKDVDAYGLFLDQVAGVSTDIDTTEQSLIIGMNHQGQLLLGFSDEHIDRPGTEGEWVYCLIFDKA